MVHSPDEHLWLTASDKIILFALERDPTFLNDYFADMDSDEEKSRLLTSLMLKSAYKGDLFDSAKLDLFIEYFSARDEYAYENLNVADDCIERFVEKMVENGWYYALVNIDPSLWINQPPEQAMEFYLQAASRSGADPEIYFRYVTDEMLTDGGVVYQLSVILWTGAPLHLYEDLTQRGLKFYIPTFSYSDRRWLKFDLDDGYERYKLFYKNRRETKENTEDISWYRSKMRYLNNHLRELAMHDEKLREWLDRKK